MSVALQKDAVTIEPAFDGAKPDAFLLDSQSVHCHLTKGFDPAKICKLGHGPAISALGTIPVTAGRGELDAWEFGFIQVVRVNSMSVFYAGRTPWEGSVGIEAHRALSQRVMLDSHEKITPWMTGRLNLPKVPPKIGELMSDHPSACERKMIQNDRTKRPNLLFHLITDYEFWTTFAAKEPGGKLHHFGHFRWALRFDFRFQWRGSTISVARSNSSLSHSPVVMGLPAESDVRKLVEAPAGPFAIWEINRGRGTAAGSPTRSDNERWFTSVPSNFFE